MAAHCSIQILWNSVEELFVVEANIMTFSVRIRRTEVRPMCKRRSDGRLAEVRSGAACGSGSARTGRTVTGRPKRFPFCRASAKPARTGVRDLALEFGEHRQQSRHGSTGGRGQVQRFGQRDETDAVLELADSGRFW